MSVLQHMRRISLGGSLLLVMLLAMSMQASAASTTSLKVLQPVFHQYIHQMPFNANAQHLQQMVQDGRLAPTVKVLSSLPPTTIIQFPLVPSGIKTAFPNATGLVTIVSGSR